MDINDLRALSVVLMFVTFLGIIGWALMGRRDRFDAAANAPFADDEPDRQDSSDMPVKAGSRAAGKEYRS